MSRPFSVRLWPKDLERLRRHWGPELSEGIRSAIREAAAARAAKLDGYQLVGPDVVLPVIPPSTAVLRRRPKKR